MKARKPRKSESEMSNVSFTMLIDHYASDMLRRNCTADSITTNRRTLERFRRFFAPNGEALRLSYVTSERVEEYVTGMQSRQRKWEEHPYRPPQEAPLSPFTVRTEVKILRGFGTWLEGEGFANPFQYLEIPKVPKHMVDVLTDEEIEKILSSMNTNTPIGARLYAMVLLLLDSGLRISELADARLPNLDLQRRQLRVIGKREKERFVPFGTRCTQATLRYVNLYRPEPVRPEYDNVFLALDGMPMTRNSVECIIRRLKKSTGISRLHAHLFRHTFAVKFLTNGGDLITLQAIMGHESLEVTRKCLHFTTAQHQARYEQFSPVDRMPFEGFRRFGQRKEPGSASAQQGSDNVQRLRTSAR